MDKSLFKFDDFFKSACYFEASLVLVAVFLGWVAGIDPFENIYFSETAIAYGVIGTVPLFLMFLALEKMQGESVTTIRKLLLNTLGPGLHRYHWTDLFLLAAIAGVAEELLFRGVIQPWIEAVVGHNSGLDRQQYCFWPGTCRDTALCRVGSPGRDLFGVIFGLWRRKKFVNSYHHSRILRFSGFCCLDACVSGQSIRTGARLNCKVSDFFTSS